MCVPAFEWRKNAETLIRAFARTKAVHDGVQLVLACAVPPTGLAAWRELAAKVGLAEHSLVITGFVADEVLRALYQVTALNVFPSRYEGFGLPVAEAARCGAPCITSNRGSLPEVLDLPSSTFDPDDIDGLASMIDRGLTDTRWRDELVQASGRAAATHTWDNTARRALDAYELLDAPAGFSALSAWPHAATRIRRPKVAVVGPLPPVPSGVAVYTKRVFDALGDVAADRYEVDIYADAAPASSWPPAFRGAARAFPAQSYGTHTSPYDYDARIYCLGASQFHVDTLDAVHLAPGIVWLHDVNLVGLYLEWAKHRQWQLRYGWRGDRAGPTVAELLTEVVRTTYGDALPTDVFDLCSTYDDYVETNVTFAAAALRDATHVIVGSALARAAVEADFAFASLPVPELTVLPHAIPTRAPARPGAPHGEWPPETSGHRCLSWWPSGSPSPASVRSRWSMRSRACRGPLSWFSPARGLQNRWPSRLPRTHKPRGSPIGCASRAT